MNNFTAEQNRFMERTRPSIERLVALFARFGIELKISVRRKKDPPPQKCVDNVVRLRRLRVVK